MKDISFKVLSLVHRFVKRLTGGLAHPNFDFVNVPLDKIGDFEDASGRNRNDVIAPRENTVSLSVAKKWGLNSFIRSKTRYNFGVSEDRAVEEWLGFIERSRIEEGYPHSNLSYGGYILGMDCGWCLPSWVWTNAAQVRYLASRDVEKARPLADLLLNLQLEDGGWLVRYDYSEDGPVPILAPNDSAYIANNAMLEMYLETKEDKWLLSATRCANWIMNTARKDGMVWTGFDLDKNEWNKNVVIVDVGFTLGFFARLFEILNDKKFLNYAHQFCESYIKLFYNKERRLFATSIDAFDQQQGGFFGRGQAWALEGLIPYVRISGNDEAKNVVRELVSNLINLQQRDGAWSYNFGKGYLGNDCKGIPVIAKALFDAMDFCHQMDISPSIERALQWCMRMTSLEGESRGGIFCFSMEGAIVHHLYTETALVYSSVYACETLEAMRNEA